MGRKFTKILDKYIITHDRIHPAITTENVIIERWHRTFKEILCEMCRLENY